MSTVHGVRNFSNACPLPWRTRSRSSTRENLAGNTRSDATCYELPGHLHCASSHRPRAKAREITRRFPLPVASHGATMATGNDDQPARRPWQSPPLSSPKDTLARHPVRPAIFEYSCKGYLHLEDTNTSSRVPSKNASARNKGLGNDLTLQSLPYCRGIESRLRKVRELPPSTRDASIMDFIDYVSVEPSHRRPEGENSGDVEAGDTKGSDQRSGKTTGPTVAGGRRPPIGPAPALPVLPGSADYGPPPDDVEDGSPSDLGRRKSGSVQILPPTKEYAVDDTDNAGMYSYSTLSCWGMTNVSVLMLTKPDGSKEVAAVAPENTLGVTVRDEGNAQGGDAVGTVRVGPIEVAVVNHYQSDSSLQREEGKELNNDDATGEERGRSTMDGAANDANKKLNPGHRPHNRPENHDEQDTSDPNSDPFSDRLAKTLSRTADSMRDNAKTVTDAQFPVRMYKSGERIVGEFGKTLQRTGKVAKDICKMWSDDDDDDSSDD